MAIAFGFAGCPDGNNGGDPDLTGTVSITGTAKVGQTLTADTSALGGNGTIAYQWKRTKDGTTTDIGTNSTYAVQAADEGFTITVTVTRSGYSGSKTSGPTATVTAAGSGDTDLTGTVSISGTARVGETLTAVTTALGGSGTITYQWNSEETAIPGANSSTYLVQAADEGSTITVTVTRSGFSGSKTSEPTETVAAEDSGDTDLTGTVTVTFTPNTETVCVDPGGPPINKGNETVTFQWKKDGSNVGTATTTNPNKYTPTTAGSYTVTVSATNYNPKTSTAVSVSAHDYSNWIQTTVPTFITEGVETRTCANESSHTETRTVDPLPIASTANWTTALSQIAGKGNAGKYILTIEGEVDVAGNTTTTFGTTATATSLEVTLQGNGKLSLTSDGNLIRISANQTLIIDSEDLALEGRADNYTSVVNVTAGGTLELQNGTVSGNTSVGGGGVYVTGIGATFTMSGGKISGNSTANGGGGVLVSGNGATFTMDDGEISGNNTSTDGGGVYVSTNGTFTMRGGEISGNTATNSGGGVYVSNSSGTFTMLQGGKIFGNTATTNGGGVYNAGTFRIVTGTIYGSDEVVSLRNTAVNGAALYKGGTGGTAQRGTFSGAGDAWVGTNLISSGNAREDTIKVDNGDIVP
jgi:hypothetical protein